MPLSKPFVIATEGQTVDGRKISREWLSQMADHYDPRVYTAVANLEHFISALPDSVFGAYGKVVSLSTQVADVMGEKKMQLLAVVDANEQLVALQKAGRKAFASIEILHDFVGKGIAYLGGLAFTDTPASIGTESMKFSIGGAAGERFSCSEEVTIEFEAEERAGDSLFAKVKELIGLGKKNVDDRFADHGKAVEVIAQSQKELLEAYASAASRLEDLDKKLKAAEASITSGQEAFSALQKTLGQSDDSNRHRPPATGGNGQVKTDC